MTMLRTAALVFIVVLMTTGQILFKLAAQRVESSTSGWELVSRLAFNPYMICAVIIYGLTTVLWVLVLTDEDLSRSYLFTALAMILVPLAGIVFFKETVSLGLLVGGGLIIAGLVVVSLF